MLPVGVVKVKFTVAPETGVPPLVTVAVMGTLPGGTKFAAETETLTAREGGVTTVAFARSVAVEPELVALRSTAYVPAGVPEGALLPIVNETDWPGLNTTDDDENDVDQPEGSLELRLMVLGAQADESLLVTETE